MAEILPPQVHLPTPAVANFSFDLFPLLDSNQQERACPVEESPTLECSLVQKENGDVVVVFQAPDPNLQLNVGLYQSQLEELTGAKLSVYNVIRAEGLKNGNTDIEGGFYWEYDFNPEDNTAHAIYKILGRDVWVNVSDLYQIALRSLVDVEAGANTDTQAAPQAAVTIQTQVENTPTPGPTSTPWFAGNFPIDVTSSEGGSVQFAIELIAIGDTTGASSGLVMFNTPEGVEIDMPGLCGAIAAFKQGGANSVSQQECLSSSLEAKTQHSTVWKYVRDKQSGDFMIDISYSDQRQYLMPLSDFRILYSQYLLTDVVPTPTSVLASTEVAEFVPDTSTMRDQVRVAMLIMCGGIVALLGFAAFVRGLSSRRMRAIDKQQEATDFGPVVHNRQTSEQEEREEVNKLGFEEVFVRLNALVSQMEKGAQNSYNGIIAEILENPVYGTEQKTAAFKTMLDEAEGMLGGKTSKENPSDQV